MVTCETGKWRPLLIRGPILIAAVAVVGGTFGCEHRAVDLEGRSCEDGTCVDGFVCDAVHLICVLEDSTGSGDAASDGNRPDGGDALRGDGGDPLPGDTQKPDGGDLRVGDLGGPDGGDGGAGDAAGDTTICGDCTVEPWWDTRWSRRLELTLHNAAQAEELIDFPILVIINDPPVDYAQIKSAGEDLRFIDPVGDVELRREIELFDAGGTSTLWVRVPSIPGGSTKTLWMYYGNGSAAAPPGNHAAQVWTNGYEAVWHMSGTGSTHLDSTSNGNHATSVGSPTQDATGQIGGAVGFNEGGGHSDSLRADHHGSLTNLTALTLEAWIRPLSLDEAEQRIVQKRRGRNEALYGLHYATWEMFPPHNPRIAFRINDATWRSIASSTATAPLAAWSYIAVSHDLTAQGGVLYVNSETPQLFSMSRVPDWATQEQIDIGGVEGRDARGFSGRIDEVRISSVARSNDWTAAQYLSMIGAFVTYGFEETQ